MNKGNEKIKFAPFLFTAIKNADEQLLNIDLQAAIVKQAVEKLGGTIPSNCSKYLAKKYATEEAEQNGFEKLLKYARKSPPPFDAVIIATLKRWAQDKRFYHESLDILNELNIRFFVAEREYNLTKPSEIIELINTAKIEDKKELNFLKKILARKKKAKEGKLPSSRVPYGRTYNRETCKWDFDKKKRDKINEIARRYLKGESIAKMAKEIDMYPANLWKILTKLSGDKWVIQYDTPDPKDNLTLSVPRLLDDDVIARIKEKAEDNKANRSSKKYLLSQMIFCADCKSPLYGQTTTTKLHYYRHAKLKPGVKCSTPKIWVRADLIDEAVRKNIIKKYSDYDSLDKIEENLKPHIEDSGRSENSTLTRKFAARYFRKPFIDQMIASNFMVQLGGRSDFDHYRYEKQRDIVESIFSGIGIDGKQLGIFVSPVEGTKKLQECELVGHEIREKIIPVKK